MTSWTTSPFPTQSFPFSSVSTATHSPCNQSFTFSGLGAGSDFGPGADQTGKCNSNGNSATTSPRMASVLPSPTILPVQLHRLFPVLVERLQPLLRVLEVGHRLADEVRVPVDVRSRQARLQFGNQLLLLHDLPLKFLDFAVGELPLPLHLGRGRRGRGGLALGRRRLLLPLGRLLGLARRP